MYVSTVIASQNKILSYTEIATKSEQKQCSIRTKGPSNPGDSRNSAQEVVHAMRYDGAMENLGAHVSIIIGN
jgi:hypothetical protein